MSTFPVLKDTARIAIINRGEAALRFIRAVREYNDLYGTEMETVALYTDVEENALFVKMADDEVQLSSLQGYPGKQKSPYLDHDLMLSAIEKAGADGIWVGWGFVSEDAEFAAKIEEKGIVFIGPSSKAMALLGDKIQAKELAEKADVPILPWSKRSIKDLDDAQKMALQIGYPVIVKAANAGGGRGIRFVRTPEEMERQFLSAREETVRITGNDIVFIEHLVEEGRHLEVQTLTDTHGNIHTFGVRDCSVQRKNQKIIEETPPPHLSLKLIKEIEASAARMIKSANYAGAGTVEYLYDLRTKKYYFMEVNTRLQVEHPITETLYSIDLVKGQIHVARGLELDLHGASPNGHVIEVRLNAEAPEKDFTPAPGEVEIFKAPAGPGIRVDSGIEQGSTIPSEFDSMVAKIISAAPTREEAIARLKRALKELRIRIKNGTTNRAFLLELLDNPAIRKGGVSTGFVEQLLKKHTQPQNDERVRLALLAGAVEMYHSQLQNDYINFKEQITRLGRPRTSPVSEGYTATLSVFGNKYEFLVKHMGTDRYHISLLDDEKVTISCRYATKQREGIIITGGTRHTILVVPRGDMLQIEVDGYPVYLESESGGVVKSPSPAVVLGVKVQPGQKVKKGETLIVLEAMKMEMLVEAPGDGTVKEIHVSPGSQVASGASLVALEIGETSAVNEEKQYPRVSFNPYDETPSLVFEHLVKEFHAIFLGYDQNRNTGAVLDSLLDVARKHKEFEPKLFSALMQACEYYVTIEQLFSQKEVVSDSFNRPVSYEELLSHYFQRESDKEKGLPEEFLESLKESFSRYCSCEKPDTEEINSALFHIFRSHGRLRQKQSLITSVFFALETIKVNPDVEGHFTRIVDSIVLLTHAHAQAQAEAQRIADAALHARYQMIDRHRIERIKEAENRAIEEMVQQILSGKSHTDEKLMMAAVNSGPYIQKYLVKLALNGDDKLNSLSSEILLKRFNRDRCIQHFSSDIHNGNRIARMNCKDIKKRHIRIILAVVSEETYAKMESLTGLFGAPDEKDVQTEAVILVKTDAASRTQEQERVHVKTENWISRLTIGWFYGGNDDFFRTYTVSGQTWEEDEHARGFDPIRFRELRIYRLRNFILNTIYRSESVTVVEGTAKENPKDKRLFALASTSEPNPILSDSDDIARMIVFEAAFMEAISALRAAQARYKYRLHWNRIIIHNRSLLGLRLMQLKDYGKRFIPRIKDLGLEKMVIYSRRKRWREDIVRELELLFLNISNDQFTLRSRTPSDVPLSQLDKYVEKVVRARQRNTVYPCELIKSLTSAGIPIMESLPRGEFTEYDIEVDKETGLQRVYQKNALDLYNRESNVIFGIISNFDTVLNIVLERVLILCDATNDFGSLAEGECRRINAAMDLAAERDIPLEWVPVSSGAKITMDSGTENLDWTAATLRRIIEFTQNGGEINIIVPNINVGAQSYWNAEATMLMHTKGLLIMTDDASMLLTGKKALDFAGSVSGETNLDIGGAEKIMLPNGQAQLRATDLPEAYRLLFRHYRYSYRSGGTAYPPKISTKDSDTRDVGTTPYKDTLGQGFSTIGDIFSKEKNPERKKPFDMRQVMESIIDTDGGYFERWRSMKDADIGIVWETRIGGYAVGLIGIESRNIPRIGSIPFDGPETWNGGTLFPLSSKKVARGINAFSGKLPLVIVANLSGFDGSPESLRSLQLEYGAEIGRAMVNFKGPVTFLVTARYHGGAYVVFSKSLNPNIKTAAIEGSYASVIGGAPAAAVVFPKTVLKETFTDPRIVLMQEKLKQGDCTQREYEDLYKTVYMEKQTALATEFDTIHSVERAKRVGSIDDIISTSQIRPYVIENIKKGMDAE
ncbi:MAG: ATP-grasp domain-containing protein [Spirochaetales bacterium]|nr:ATP-grasp domain-containing protein [Spirochaetales bacterium]